MRKPKSTESSRQILAIIDCLLCGEVRSVSHCINCTDECEGLGEGGERGEMPTADHLKRPLLISLELLDTKRLTTKKIWAVAIWAVTRMRTQMPRNGIVSRESLRERVGPWPRGLARRAGRNRTRVPGVCNSLDVLDTVSVHQIPRQTLSLAHALSLSPLAIDSPAYFAIYYFFESEHSESKITTVNFA